MRAWSAAAGFLTCWLAACSGSGVEQIEVTVPPEVRVPEDMVYIPDGVFIMGHREDPKTLLGKKVHLDAYLIDRYEVTRQAFGEGNPDYRWNPRKGRFPVAEITFAEAQAYCRGRGKRLPTEAEWEKAARGPDGRKWPWLHFQEHPNNGFSGFLPEPVDRRDEWISPYGVFGMGHNVWEWTADDWDFNGMPGRDRGRFKVIRGGLYQTHLKIDFASTYARNFMSPESRYNFLGFRCAQDVKTALSP
ncbi:MAG: formylglycine-generating enzyme family protein [Nitrospinaceae bacterium]